MDDAADLDGDGEIYERIPLDIMGHARFLDDPQTVDTGIANMPDYPDIVDMGAYEFAMDMSGPPVSGLVAFYSFDADASDSMAHRLHGTMENGARIVNDPQQGWVLSLDGIDDYVSIPKSELFHTSSVTVGAWIMPNRVDRFMRIIRQNMYNIYTKPYGVLVAQFRPASYGGGTYIQQIISRVPEREWSHFAFSWDESSGQSTGYINGSKTGSKDEDDNNPLVYSPYTYDDIFIGVAGGGGGSPFDGLIDEMAICDRALNSDEILILYNGH
jgi:hypothetical protein